MSSELTAQRVAEVTDGVTAQTVRWSKSDCRQNLDDEILNTGDVEERSQFHEVVIDHSG